MRGLIVVILFLFISCTSEVSLHYPGDTLEVVTIDKVGAAVDNRCRYDVIIYNQVDIHYDCIIIEDYCSKYNIGDKLILEVKK